MQNSDVTVEPISGYAKPFLKWAGGKSQLIPELKMLLPNKFNSYFEPFIGGGALYFFLNYGKSVISDSNEELIITYKAVKQNVSSVIDYLDSFENSEKFYYQIRNIDVNNLSNYERAARLIFLNKTCYNGLYRVNKQGKFNVPYNKNNRRIFYNKDALILASTRLRNTTILNGDYKNILLKYCKKNDFIFLDPPYHPVSKFSDFKRYTKEFFYEGDQIELANIFSKLVNKGCKVILTNSDHLFIRELYKGFEIKSIKTKRLISCNPETRTSKDIIILGGI